VAEAWLYTQIPWLVIEIEPVGPDAFEAVAAQAEEASMLLSNTANGEAAGIGVENPPAESRCLGFFFFLPFFFGAGHTGVVAVKVWYWATDDSRCELTTVGALMPARQ